MSQVEVDAIVAGIAHAIRNPIFSISANLEALPPGVLRDEQAAPFFTTIRSELTRIGRLIDQLAELGHPAEPQLAKVDLPALLGRVLREAAPEAQSRSIELRLLETPPLPAVALDAGQITQALGKIVENAVQNAASLVEIEVRVDPSQGDQVLEVEIRDDGRGFHPVAVERGFEPFFKSGSTGSGLGLTIAQRILERHHAGIVLSNRSPRGGCVRIGFHLTGSQTA